jgi:5-methylcytosine-specific restriction endonuclease McrA
MQKHTKIYMDYFGFDTGSFIACEICGTKATEVHHLECRGMGGNPNGDKDRIENLQAICRACHIKYGDRTEFKDMMVKVHLKYMEVYGNN